MKQFLTTFLAVLCATGVIWGVGEWRKTHEEADRRTIASMRYLTEAAADTRAKLETGQLPPLQALPVNTQTPARFDSLSREAYRGTFTSERERFQAEILKLLAAARSRRDNAELKAWADEMEKQMRAAGFSMRSAFDP